MRVALPGPSHASSILEKIKLHTARPLPTRSLSVRTNAGPPRPPPKKSTNPKRPDSGFFAEVDPGATVYPVRSSLQTDPTKRGGRWQSDFIWNSNWSEALDYEENLRRQIEEGRKEAAEAAEKGGEGKGFLSLTNKVDLNSMDVDLSAQLLPRPKPAVQQAGERGKKRSGVSAGYAEVPAFRGEVRTWDRGGRYSRKVVATPTPAQIEENAAQLAAENARYDELKAELQAWATGLTAAGVAATFAFYGRDVSASYAVGALGGLLYLRLLNRSVDSFGAGGIGAAIGQNRLLIPIILALGYNRYNTLVAESSGLTLQLLPMLVGFFTYKFAVVGRQSIALFNELSAPYKEATNSDDGAEGEGGQQDGSDGDFDVTNVDRAFAKKMMNG